MPKGILNANAVYIIIIVFLNNKEMTEWQIEKKNALIFTFSSFTLQILVGTFVGKIQSKHFTEY